MKKAFICLLLLISTVNTISAQFSANLESNSVYYTKKPQQTLGSSDKSYGTNDYLVANYTLNDFSAGIQVEAYKPVLRGYSPNLDGYMLAMKHLSWQKSGFSVLAGDFFEQFGSGLMFRSWEDRQLGINNSIEGGRIAYNNKVIAVKGIIGRPRLYMHHESVRISGADMNISLADLMGWKNSSLQLEGGYINKYEKLDDINRTFLSSAATNLYSASLQAEHKGVYGKFEYVFKDKDLYYNKDVSDFQERNGNAQLLEVGYNTKGLGLYLSLRRLQRMETKLTRSKKSSENIFNYLPALTRQYTYSIANINPYITQSNGEQGGQFDLYYGKNGWKWHSNVSSYFSLKGSNFMFLDCNADVTKKWNQSWKTIFLYSFQNNKIENVASSHTFLVDCLYKFTNKKALRAEMGYLYSEGYEKDWLSALAELTFAPTWSFYVSDMFNVGVTNKHYYSVGISFTKSELRFDLNFGHNRAGYICSGGVCRYSPEFTGLNLITNISI